MTKLGGCFISVKHFLQGGSPHSSLIFGIGNSNQYLEWETCIDFLHTTPPFQPMIKFYVLVGFQAIFVTIAMMTQGTSF